MVTTMHKLLLLVLLYGASLMLSAQSPPRPLWKFAVSGDSRNCGDIVMPAIAAAALANRPEFYWHLGDFRAISQIDEDIVPPAGLHLNAPTLTFADYQTKAWQDFVDHQLRPFGRLEIFLGIGNHEVIPPKNRGEWVRQFESWLDSPRLRAQRDADKDVPGARPYFHWVMHGSIDFISLDNAVVNTFDPAQLAWIRTRLAADRRSSSIKAVVVGMHEALPGSKGMSHSMCDSTTGVESGREVYNLLWNLQQAGKKVYVLASHSHFVMDDVYRTPYWGSKVLPGWIVGTAGAIRYRLPEGIAKGTIARTDVYGYLLATVMSDQTIQFAFEEVGLEALRKTNGGRFAESLIQWCYTENADRRIPVPNACKAQ
jgi:hypothetical protein